MRDIFMDCLFLIAYLKCSFKLSKTLDYSSHLPPNGVKGNSSGEGISGLRTKVKERKYGKIHKWGECLIL